MIDAHHHIWRQSDLPWLLGPEKPRIFGAYGEIKRDYLIEEYRADIARSGIKGSVYVQANWAPNWAADEAAWVQATADATGWPQAIVAFADVTEPDIRPALKKLSQHPLVRGVRHQLHWHENPLYRFAPDPDLPTEPTVQRNIAALAEYGWSFDLQVFAPQMTGAAKLAKACPEVTFILQHAGMLEDLSKTGRKAWRDGMRRLADRPNVVTKISGLGTFLRRNDPAHIADVTGETLEIFGAERCLFGSNFPIEKIWTPFKPLIDASLAAVPREMRAAVFTDTAARVYRL
ncbi:MAG: amidohydrolase family protein [Pseudomonadota bacterium]